MKLSDTTISVLKNYSTINQNLMIKAGSNLSTMSAMKNIVASAEVSETFERDVAIYDLNEFLATLSLFNNPDLDFQDDYAYRVNVEKLSNKLWHAQIRVKSGNTVSSKLDLVYKFQNKSVHLTLIK